MLVFYVAKNGSDLNCGTKENPFETVEKAQAEVRKLIENGLEGPVSVVVGAGEMVLQSKAHTLAPARSLWEDKSLSLTRI